MAITDNINLLTPSAKLSPEATRVTKQLQTVSSIALALFLVVGVVVGSAYLVLRIRHQDLSVRLAQIQQEISAKTVAEGLLVSIKDRVRVADKILATTPAWQTLFS